MFNRKHKTQNSQDIKYDIEDEQWSTVPIYYSTPKTHKKYFWP